jgi:hypothetical protein
VASQLGHTKASFTQDFYSREFDKVKHDADRRKRYSEGFGSLLSDVNTMSTNGLNQPQDEPSEQAANVAAIG